jgi:hypothetical protein
LTDGSAYGDAYQWGRFGDGHQCRNSGATSILSSTDTPGNANFILSLNFPNDWHSTQNNNLWQGVNGINNPCPSGYRLPTEAELDAERLSWSSNNSNGAFSSPLKLPLGGNRAFNNGALNHVGSDSYYWSTTISGTNARYLYFYISNANLNTDRRSYGFSVRCLQD